MASVKKELFSGVLFTAIGKYSYVVISILITAVLARILTPSDFGIVAIATVLINFFSMLSDMGIGPAIIQNKELNKEDLSSIYNLTLYMGVGLSAIFFLLAPVFAHYYDNKQLVIVIQLFSISIFFHCADIVPHNLIVKAKRFSFLAYSNVIIQIVSGVASIIAAYYGLGIYSLLIQPILSSVLLYLVDLSQYRIIPTFVIHYNSIKKIFSYSLYQFLFSFINYFSRNLDKLVVGRVFGVNELGYYEKSYRLMMLPVGNLSHVITPAIQPIFSEFQNNKNLLFQRSKRLFQLFAMMGFPISVLLYFCSKEIILIAFGEQWVGAVSVFKILSLSVGFQMIYSPQGAFFQSANAVKEMFHCGIVTALLNVFAVIVGCIWVKDILVLSWMIVAVYTLAFVITYYVMINRVFASSFLSFLKVLIGPILLSCLIVIPLYLTNSFLVDAHILLSLAIKCIATMVVVGLYELKTKQISKLIK